MEEMNGREALEDELTEAEKFIESIKEENM